MRNAANSAELMASESQLSEAAVGTKQREAPPRWPTAVVGMPPLQKKQPLVCRCLQCRTGPYLEIGW